MYQLRIKIYHNLVNRIPAIRQRYQRVRGNQGTRLKQMRDWIYLIVLNIHYYVFRSKSLRKDSNLYPDTNKKLLINKTESSLSRRESPENCVNRLLKYDVISFDIFDTLIFRPFSKPSDLFYILGEKLKYLDFERIRIEMEWKAREICYKQNGHYEVTLEEIYEVIEENVGIPKSIGMQMEIETEIEYCFANPYMLEVLKLLSRSNKKIIAISDMYLSSDVVSAMLEKCKLMGIEDIYISCEHKKSKTVGDMYQYVKEIYGIKKKYIHVGDNKISDIKMPKKYEYDTVYYQNVNEAGKPYRIEDISAINGSIYRGIVNAHIHNGLKEYSKEYEFGLIYGGPIVLGYCEFIHEYVRTHNVDKILFLSRDGDIINQVYQIMYPDENVETEYVYWSRLAATKMAAKYFKYDYFRRFLYHKVNQGYLVSDILESMELDDLMGILTSTSGRAIQCNSQFTSRNVEFIKEYLMDNWEEVLERYDEQIVAGKTYYEKVLRGKKKVVAVDVGWAGSGAVTLNYLVNEVWNFNCEVIGLLIGTNSANNTEPNASESLLNSGQLVSYAFSQSNNRKIWKKHDPGRGDNLLIESLFGSAKEGSLKNFILDADGMPQVVYKEERDKVQEEIQEGILDFVRLAGKLEGISGADVGAIMRFVCVKKCGEREFNNKEINI